MNKFKYAFDGKEIKKDIKCITIPVDLYKSDVVILMPKEAAIVSERWGQETNYGAITSNHLAESNKVLIRMKEVDDENLVHELTHAAQLIMSWIGHDHCAKECNEPFAYLVGYLFKEAKKGIKEYNKKKKKVDKPK